MLRARRRIFEKWLGEFTHQAPAVLDVGGRLQPYRPLIRNAGMTYTAVDMRPSPFVDLVGDACALPVPDASCDLVICTQVLEYVAEPARAIAEMHRALRPGGIALLSLPAVCPIDAHEDAWRFLPASIRHITAAFGNAEIVAETGVVASLFRTVAIWLTMLSPTVPRYTLVPVLNLAGLALDRMLPINSQGFVSNYSVRLRKN